MTYQEAIEFVEHANQYAGELGLDAIYGLLEEMENPHKKLKYIHVGGTNGKGSICSYLSSILAFAGYKVGRYISPVIREYREKIQVASCRFGAVESVYISEEMLIKYVIQIKEACRRMVKKGKKHPTTFEIETVLGFLFFLEENCDVVLLEVGMGGRLDATNVIEHAECTVLGSISMDHKEYLGETLAEIATEKAGIIKFLGDVVAYDYGAWSSEWKQEDCITKVLLKKAEEMSANITFADFSEISKVCHSIDGIHFDYREWKDIYIPLLGENQVKNAAVAIETVLILQKKGWNISQSSVYRGLKQVKWKGRFEIIKKSPLYIVDGAHNTDGARSLAGSINLYLKGKKLLFIVGILADKDYKGILEQVAGYAHMILTITPDNSRALSARALKDEALPYCRNVEAVGDMGKALKLAEKMENEYDGIVIFGSLYSLHLVYEYMEK